MVPASPAVAFMLLRLPFRPPRLQEGVPACAILGRSRHGGLNEAGLAICELVMHEYLGVK